MLTEISSCLGGVAEGDTETVDSMLGKIDADIFPSIEQFRLEGREASSLFQFWDDYFIKVSEPIKLYLASSCTPCRNQTIT